ncbi:gliding motility-associated-like protein [Pontibacter aydingkolensis]|uniref:Gliding motility-associated C-terminal domain-containing protein n=1 Tax=Pontibacter aydingkolensis TaxID=1911536 RepID=A0ABS7CWG1_9BACT|nr:invasin domain 3-containing protein [Pontibacter aydingkolensis]MBW7468167.1 gliding motility-associated C-terminal domain-containing protein [Pontibacter aydingkolensis]
MKKLYFLSFLLLCSFLSFGQTKGLIYKPASTAEGRAILDPNKDGYTSKTTAGFKTNDRGNGESEISYKNIPILENEPIQDPLRGPGCGFTDMVDSGVGDPVMFYFDGTNFLVRFRLNKTSPNSKGYSVLIDTDQKFGFSGPNADPNAVAGNPGFEMEMVLMSNHGVALYNINGTTTPTLIVKKDYESHTQKSIAFTQECGDPDYFYDFYMPWSEFGLPVDTKLRMVALTVMNPHPSMGNNAKSDVGGVDDRKYGGNYDKLFDDFIRNYNPTSPQDNNSGISGRTLCPSVDAGVTVTSTSITGTSTEAAGTAITVYKNGVAYGTKAYVTASNTWSLSVAGLAEGDVITASAKATNKEESESNCSGVLVGQVCTRPAAPTLSGSNGNSNKYVTITVATSGTLNLYLGSQSLVTNFNAVAGTTYYFCPSAGIVTQQNGCNGGNNLAAGVYRVTLTVGGCTSNSSFLCVNTSTNSATPTVDIPITTASRFITGTAIANAQVILKINGAEKVRLTASATGTWSVPASSLGLASGNTITAYALEDGKCQSAETAAITVTQPVTFVPSITGTYCGTSTTITGTSAEAAGTTIKLFLNGSTTALATTTTGANGNWSITGVSVAPGATLTAKATAVGKTESLASSAIAVKAISSNAGITINSTTDPVTSEKYIMEDATSISGTAPGGSGIISLYLDEMFIGSGTLNGGNWTVSKASFPNDFYLFAGAKLTATFTAVGGCESDFTVPTVAIRCAPPADRTVTPNATVECTGAMPQVTVNASEASLIYQLYNGATPISSSVLGNGGNIVLQTSTPLTATAANTLVNLKVVASKIPYVAGVNCDTEMSQKVVVTVNPVIENNTISLPSGGGSYCGPANVGAITGSTPTGGDGSYAYQWQNNASGTWADISGATGKNYSPGLVSTTTSYRRKVFSAACSNEDASASVEVKILATVANNVTYNGQTSFCGSGTPTQILGNTDAAFISYQWQSSQDGTTFGNIANATEASYTLGNLTQTTTFRRVVNNGTCESYSSVITITITPAVSNNTITAPATVILCAAGNVSEIVGSAPTGGVNTYTFKWQQSTDNGITFSDISPAVTTQNYTPGTVSSTTYFRRIVTSGPCTDSESNVVKITVVSVAKTTITTDETTLAANGTSSTTIRVQLKDAFDTIVNTDACTLNLTTDKGTITNRVYAGNGAYTATLTAGTTSGIANVTGNINSAAISDNAEVTLEPALKLAATTITASPSSLYADGTSTSVATVAFKDYAGNAILVDATKVEVLLDGVVVTATDKGNGEFTVIVPARSAAASVVVTAKYNGVSTGAQATVDFVPVPVVVPNPSLTVSTVTAAPTQINADGMSTSLASVQFKGADGSAMIVDPTKVQLFFDGVSVVITDKGNGLYEGTVPARTIAAVVSVTAKYDGASLSSTASVSFVPAVNLAATLITASPVTVNADGTSTSTVTVTFKDYAGNLIAVDPANVGILLNNVAATFTAGATGVFTATVPARTTAAVINATATYNSSALSGNATVTFVPVVNLTATVVSASPVTVDANGTSTSTAKVEFKDYAGNAIAVDEAKVQLLLDNVAATVLAKGTGVYEAIIPARTISQMVTVTAKYDNIQVTDNATVTFVPAINLAATEVTALPGTVNADGVSTSVAQLTFKDYAGNSIEVDASKVEILLGGVSVTVNAGATGVFTATVPARTTAATVTVTAKYNNAAVGGSATVNFVPALNFAATSVTASPATVNADGTSTSTATVTFRDYAGNTIAIDPAKLGVYFNGSSVTFTSGTTGVYTALVPARTTAEAVEITAKYDGAAIREKATVTFIPVLNLAATVVKATPLSVNADGVSTSIARVEFRDFAGNAISVDVAKVGLFADNALLTGLQGKGNGVFEAEIPARTVAAIVEITARYDGTTVADKAHVEFVLVVQNPVLSLQLSTVTANPTTVVANGVSASLITVQLKDTNGNNFTTTEAVSITSNFGTIAAYTNNGNGNYTATIASAVVGTATITAQVGTSELVAKPVVNFVIGSANGATSTIVASVPSIPADGVSSSLITVTLYDAQNRRITTGGNNVALTTTRGTLGTVTDNNNGTYTATLTASTTAGIAVVSGTVNGSAISSTASVTFTALPVANRAPVAANDAYTVNNHEKLTGNVLLNDTDPDGNQLVVKTALIRQPLFGTVIMQANGSFTYTPNKGYAGEDSFTYEVCDTGNPSLCAQATVTIQVKQGLVFIPEGFSPDGDGENDTFVIYGAEQYKVSLKIFNRWGDVVYENKIYKNDWNGAANAGLVIGDKLPDGTYFYIVDLNNGEKPRTHSLIIKRK